MEGKSKQTAVLDTNLLVRYLTEDEPAKADAVENLLDKASRDAWIMAFARQRSIRCIYSYDKKHFKNIPDLEIIEPAV